MKWNRRSRPDGLERVELVFVVAPAGAEGARLAQALASLRGGTASSEEPAPAVSLGDAGERVEASGSDVGSGRIGVGALDLTAFDGAPKRALQIPHLAQTKPRARFILCWRDPRATIAAAYRGWSSGHLVTYPDLDEWPGPAWSYALVPGWRELAGRSLAAIVAAQWASVTDFLLTDLERLDPGRWLATSHETLAAAPAAELERICGELGVDPAGLDAASEILADLDPPDPAAGPPDELEAELPELDSRSARLRNLVDGIDG